MGIGNGNKNCLLLPDIIDKVLSLTIENQILIAINFSLTALLTFGTLYLCKDPRVQPPLSSKFAVKKSLIDSIRASLSVCIEFRSFVPEELDMNLTSLKVGIHRHCSINKLN